jgi:tRNA(fMet)-specific endonuclease VapC
MELSDTKERNLRRLLHEIEDVVMWPFDVPAAKQFGKLYAYLMRRGRPMPQIDIQIAAIALTLSNCTLITADSDFAAIPGLDIEDWS